MEVWAKDPSAARVKLLKDHTFEFMDITDKLQEFSSKLSAPVLIKMFGEQIGYHLMDKFVSECRRDLLLFFNKIDSNYRAYIIHCIISDKHIYVG